MRAIRLILAALLPALFSATAAASGLPERMSAAQARELMSRTGAAVTVVDVRTREEYESAHIPGAVNVPVDLIEAGQVPVSMADRNRTYLLYCRSGHRAGIALGTLKARGYRSVTNFGGIGDWPYGTVTGPKP